MIRLCAQIYCGAFIVLLLSACSATFQSNQFNFIKSLFAQKTSLPEKNWQVRWQGKIYPVFAVNHTNGTFFADEHGLFVSFDGWHIRQVSISRPNHEKISVIEKTTASDGSTLLEYRGGNPGLLALDRCQVWKRENSTAWKQACEGTDASGGIYTNIIEVNPNGELVALQFKVLPGADPMEITLKSRGRRADDDKNTES